MRGARVAASPTDDGGYAASPDCLPVRTDGYGHTVRRLFRARVRDVRDAGNVRDADVGARARGRTVARTRARFYPHRFARARRAKARRRGAETAIAVARAGRASRGANEATTPATTRSRRTRARKRERWMRLR
tara:strand:+ start:19207 stop:19605 length:399 start_codon:yes stop_codon:yes gene_type:complete